MIDAKLLKELGWSADLISETTRIADSLQEVAKPIAEVTSASTVFHSVGASEIFADAVQNVSSQSYSISEPLRKKSA